MWSIQIKTALGLAVAVVVLIVAVLASQRSISHFVTTGKWVSHTHEVIEHLIAVSGGLTAAESGSRGYVITGLEQHLRSYEAGVDQVSQQLAALWPLTRDDAAQQQRLRLVEDLVGQRLAGLRDVVEARGRHGVDGGAAVVRTDRGRQLTEQIRAQLDAIEAAERGLLAERQQAVEESAARAWLAVVSGTGLAVVVATMVLVLLFREMRARDRAQAELRASECRLQALINHSPALITVKDLTGHFMLINRQYEQHCQRRAEEIIGRTVEELWPPGFAAVYRANDVRVIESGVALTVEEEAPGEDGRRRL